MKVTTTHIVIVSLLGAALLIGLVVYVSPKRTSGEELIPFAQCLKEAGAEFYGAFWCPHCQAQKALFGRAAGELPYTECSTADTKGQLPVCTEKDIKNYPTWHFADGSTNVGEMTLGELSAKTNCPLPTIAPNTFDAAATSTVVSPGSSSSAL